MLAQWPMRRWHCVQETICCWRTASGVKKQWYRVGRSDLQFDNEAGRARAIHKNGHLGPLDDDADVKPLIAVGFRNYGPFVLAGVLGSERLPGPTWMGDVLHGVTAARRVSRAKVEWPEVHGVVRLRIHHAERDAGEAPVKRVGCVPECPPR